VFANRISGRPSQIARPDWKNRSASTPNKGRSERASPFVEIKMLARPALTRPDQPAAETPKGQARPTEKRFWSRVDGQMRRSFSSKEPVMTAGRAIKKAFPVVVVTIEDTKDGVLRPLSSSRTVMSRWFKSGPHASWLPSERDVGDVYAKGDSHFDRDRRLSRARGPCWSVDCALLLPGPNWAQLGDGDPQA
jgi:hypothetical protein